MNKHINVRIQQLLVLAQASPCPRRKFGAMIYDPDTKALIADGYNGAPRGGGHLCGGSYCVRDGLPRDVKTEAVEVAVAMSIRTQWWWALSIDGGWVVPTDPSQPSTAGHELDQVPRRLFGTKEEALEYERATRAGGGGSGREP